MLTDRGLCRTINSESIRDIYASTEYTDTLLDNMVPNNQSIKGLKIAGQGASFSVKLVLDVQEYLREYEYIFSRQRSAIFPNVSTKILEHSFHCISQ